MGYDPHSAVPGAVSRDCAASRRPPRAASASSAADAGLPGTWAERAPEPGRVALTTEPGHVRRWNRGPVLHARQPRRKAVSPMMELPLVVGVDGSDPTLTAVAWAVDEAARRGLPLRLVYASLWERYEGAVSPGSTQRPSEQVMAEHIIASAAERARLRNPE